MALPLPKVVADTGPGGGLVTAMGGINSLANDNILRQINDIKKQYLPTTMRAEAASKLAYANLMGPQFLAKIMGNEGALANMSEAQKREALGIIHGAATGQGGGNSMNNIPSQPTYSGIGQPSTNSFSGWVGNTVKNLFGQKPPQSNTNAINQRGGTYDNSSNPGVSADGPGVINNGNPFVGRAGYKKPDEPVDRYANNGTNNEVDAAWQEWLKSPEGIAQLEHGEQANMPSEEYLVNWNRKRQGKPTISMDMTGGRHEPTYAENTGNYKGTVKQGEEAGKYRAEALKNIGESQLGLSNSGVVLNRMTNIIKDPVFQQMRSKIPFFQDKQLSYLAKTGTPEEQKKIGDFLSTAESFIASTVQGFAGKPLVREFDLAQRQKINPNDTVHVAEGKLHSAIALHDIAEKKNDIIAGLIGQGVNEADAVRQANKMVDISKIEKATEQLLRDKPTEDDIKYMVEKYKTSPEEIRKRLKAKGVI